MTEKNYLTYLESLENIIYNINEANIESSIENILNNFDDEENSFSFYVITQLTFSTFIWQKGEAQTILTFLRSIYEKKKTTIQDMYSIKTLLSSLNCAYKPQESLYFLGKMIEEKMIEPSFVESLNSIYFMQYFPNKEPKKFKDFYFLYNVENLRENDFALHKQLVKDGINPNEIAKIIRNDEIEKFQEISSLEDFNYDQHIIPSLYERFSFINTKGISLIDYAAFFGSIKCFKYLLLNKPSLENIGQFAAAGGNLEIFHLCENNNASFEGSVEILIEYHRNDIFKYLYENKNDLFKSKDINLLGKKCIIFFNYELLSYLEDNGLKANKEFVIESAKIGNLYLFKHFYDKKECNSHAIHILTCVMESGNIEFLKYLLKNIKMNINDKNVFCIVLELFCFIIYPNIFIGVFYKKLKLLLYLQHYLVI